MPMTSVFDLLDKRHRPAPPIKPEPMIEGQDCPDPKCCGHMERQITNLDGSGVLACDCCGWTQEARS